MKTFPVFIEIPAGSKAKYEVDIETGILKLSKFLFAPVRYPANYGFVPRTLAKDGDPIDVLLLAQEPLTPCVIVDARPIGGIRLEDEKGIDDKIICVPLTDPFFRNTKSLKSLSSEQVREIRQFFKQYKEIEGIPPQVRGFMSRKQARKALEFARRNYTRRYDIE